MRMHFIQLKNGVMIIVLNDTVDYPAEIAPEFNGEVRTNSFIHDYKEIPNYLYYLFCFSLDSLRNS
jgi:hypothetical protein